jgi:hypothetical protein
VQLARHSVHRSVVPSLLQPPVLVVPIDDASLSNVQLVSESTSGRAAAPHDADEPLQVMSSGREDEEATQPLHQQSSSASQLSGAHPPTPSPPPPPHALASSSSTAAAASHLERKSTADDTSQPSRQQAAQPFTLSFTQQSTLAAAGGVLASESGAAAVDEQQSENAFGDDSGDDASVAPRLCVPQTQVPNEEASLHEHLHEAEASDGSAQAVVVDVLVPSSVPDSPLLLQQPARPPPPPEMSLVIESEHSVDDVVVPPTQFDDDGEVVVTDSVVVSVSAERSSSESFTAPSTATESDARATAAACGANHAGHAALQVAVVYDSDAAVQARRGQCGQRARVQIASRRRDQGRVARQRRREVSERASVAAGGRSQHHSQRRRLAPLCTDRL